MTLNQRNMRNLNFKFYKTDCNDINLLHYRGDSCVSVLSKMDGIVKKEKNISVPFHFVTLQ